MRGGRGRDRACLGGRELDSEAWEVGLAVVVLWQVIEVDEDGREAEDSVVVHAAVLPGLRLVPDLRRRGTGRGEAQSGMGGWGEAAGRAAVGRVRGAIMVGGFYRDTIEGCGV